MFPIVAYVFFAWVWFQLARENGLKTGVVFAVLAGGVIVGAMAGWYLPHFGTIGICALCIVMILMTWGRDPWS